MFADQVQIPMVISAVAVIATLLYASMLDIKDRRVPFMTWLPMLCTGLICTSYMFWEKTANASMVFGYLALIAVFLYDDYLSNRGRKDTFGLMWYYRESAIFPYLIITLALPAVSWIILNNNNPVQAVSWYGIFAAIILYISWLYYSGQADTNPQEKKTGKKRRKDRVSETLLRWYFVPIIIIFAVVPLMMFSGSWGVPGITLLFLAVFCGVFYIFGTMNLFGGADAWALIFISFCIPVFPVTPIYGESPIGVFSFSVLINALILNLVVPFVIFGINILKGNRGPLIYMFFGFPVKGEKIQTSWGFVMEDFTEKNGVISRKFIGFWDTVKRVYRGKGRVYTKALREDPERYARELNMYRKAGTVWISYAVPFIIPITAGLITALIFGDFLLILMKWFAGV